MQVMVNGEPVDVVAGASVLDLLRMRQLDPRFLAVERNRQVVPRAQHAETKVSEGDVIEIVTLVGGG